MTEFKSNITPITNQAESIFTFLDDFKNFECLLPDQVTNWQATKDVCSFTIKGMASLTLIKGPKTAFNYLSYASEGNTPFELSLHFHLTHNDGVITETQVIFKADLNPMIKMMASRPLQNLVNIIAEKLKEKMGKPA
jgi:carbon monoxide dehydrogenase subunit G